MILDDIIAARTIDMSRCADQMNGVGLKFRLIVISDIFGRKVLCEGYCRDAESGEKYN